MVVKFHAIGCISQSARQVAFYLPIFILAERSGLYIQDMDLITGRVNRFVAIEDSVDNLFDLPERRGVSVGDRPLYVFNDGFSFHIGTLNEIETTVRAALHLKHRNSLALEWAELYGSPDEKRAARSYALEAVRHNKSSEAGRSFASSLFVNSLWDAVTSNIHPDADPEDLLALYKPVLFSADPSIPDLLPSYIWPQLAHLLRIEPQEFRDIVLRELPVEALEIQEEESGFAAVEIDEKALAEAAARLRRTGRQEERIAIILAEMIDRPQVAEFLLSVQQDRGKLAREMIEYIRVNLSDLQTYNQREEFVAGMVQIMFTRSFSFTQGELLYYLAKHLGRFAPVAQAIRSKMKQSNAYNVWQMKSYIEKELVGSQASMIGSETRADSEQPDLFE